MKIIKPEMYLHPADAAAVESVEKLPGCEKVLEFASKNSIEKMYKLMYSSSYYQMTPGNAPKVFEMFGRICERFGVNEIPELYITRDYVLDMKMIGIEKPFFLITTAVFEEVPPELLETFFVSNIAAIAAGHGKMYFIEELINVFSPLLGKAADALKLPVKAWLRQNWFSYDRARLLYSDNFEGVIRLMDVSNAPWDISVNTSVEERLAQASELISIDGTQGLAKNVLTMNMGIAWNPVRMVELHNWVESGMYQKVLEENEL